MKLVSNQISPNLGAWDVIRAGFSRSKNLERILKHYFGTKNYLLTNSARTALGLIADTVQPDKRKKIGLPAFICAVVATPFLARGHQIQWLDTDEHGVLDVKQLERHAKKLSLVVVPHIFGQAAPIKAVMKIAQKHDIFVVEDSAHLIRQLESGPPEFEPSSNLVRTRSRDRDPGIEELEDEEATKGTSDSVLADAQILSFGREKVVSCVSGGALLWPQNSPFAQDFAAIQLPAPRWHWTLRHLLQPIIYALSLSWWQVGGKVIPWLGRQLHLLPLAVSPAEKQGHEDFPVATLSCWQQKILAQQLRTWARWRVHALALAPAWEAVFKAHFPTASVWFAPTAFRVIVQFASPRERDDFYWSLRQNQASFHLEEWTGIPISPRGIDYHAFGYRPGQCPKAEYFARTYLTLPTNRRTKKRDIKRFGRQLPDLTPKTSRPQTP